jgi:hypothetical protein
MMLDLCGFRPGYADLSKEMARWKKEPETSWLEDASSQALQQPLKISKMCGTGTLIAQGAEGRQDQSKSGE